MKQLSAGGIVPVAAGVALGLGVWNLVQGFVSYVFSPLIAAFIGNALFELNSFSINASEIRYGALLEAVFVVVALILLLSLLLPRFTHTGDRD